MRRIDADQIRENPPRYVLIRVSIRITEHAADAFVFFHCEIGQGLRRCNRSSFEDKNALIHFNHLKVGRVVALVGGGELFQNVWTSI